MFSIFWLSCTCVKSTLKLSGANSSLMVETMSPAGPPGCSPLLLPQSRGQCKPQHSQAHTKTQAAAENSSFTDLRFIIRPGTHIVAPPGVWVLTGIGIENELPLLSAQAALTSTYSCGMPAWLLYTLNRESSLVLVCFPVMATWAMNQCIHIFPLKTKRAELGYNQQLCVSKE